MYLLSWQKTTQQKLMKETSNIKFIQLIFYCSILLFWRFLRRLSDKTKMRNILKEHLKFLNRSLVKYDTGADPGFCFRGDESRRGVWGPLKVSSGSRA